MPLISNSQSRNSGLTVCYRLAKLVKQSPQKGQNGPKAIFGQGFVFHLEIPPPWFLFHGSFHVFPQKNWQGPAGVLAFRDPAAHQIVTIQSCLCPQSCSACEVSFPGGGRGVSSLRDCRLRSPARGCPGRGVGAAAAAEPGPRGVPPPPRRRGGAAGRQAGQSAWRRGLVGG